LRAGADSDATRRTENLLRATRDQRAVIGTAAADNLGAVR
jgi:hypothetical protein